MRAQKKLCGLAVAAALAFGAAGAAQAGVLAQGTLQITNFIFSIPGGGPVTAGQLDQLQFEDSSQITATLLGTSDTGSTSSTTPGILDLPQQCVDLTGGTTCASFGENNFSLRTAPATTDVARGDSLLAGAPIVFDPTIPAGAIAQLVAEAQLENTVGTGSTSADLGLTSTFSFVLGTDTAITISMASLSHLIATLDIGSFGTARAAESWTLSVVNAGTQATVFRWTPDGVVGTGITGGTETADDCSLTETRSTQTSGTTVTYDCSGLHSATTNVLLANQSYTLTLTHTNNASINLVPEPGSLLLLGFGLAGLGFAGYRRRKLVA